MSAAKTFLSLRNVAITARDCVRYTELFQTISLVYELVITPLASLVPYVVSWVFNCRCVGCDGGWRGPHWHSLHSVIFQGNEFLVLWALWIQVLETGLWGSIGVVDCRDVVGELGELLLKASLLVVVVRRGIILRELDVEPVAVVRLLVHSVFRLAHAALL